MQVPMGAPSTYANEVLGKYFSSGVGCPSPLYILAVPKLSYYCPNTVRSNPYFLASCEFAQRLITATRQPGQTVWLDAHNLLGPTFHPDLYSKVSPNVTCIEWNNGVLDLNFDALSLLTNSGLLSNFKGLRKLYLKLWETMVSQDQVAAVISINPPADVMTTEGFGLVQTIRKLIEETKQPASSPVTGTPQRCELDVFLLSEASILYDIVINTFKKLPKAMSCTLVVCFIMIGLTFKAAFLPVKMFITVAVPLAWAYGIIVLVYQEEMLDKIDFGLLDKMGLPALKGGKGLLWNVPTFTCTLLMGLALDYDLFLFSRIWELRREGYSNLDAIRLGVASSGNVIALAGAIFVSEFSGLLLSPIPASNQVALTIIIAVLTFVTVVENCLVPALLSLSTDINWWPLEMPEPSRHLGKRRTGNLVDVQDDNSIHAAIGDARTRLVMTNGMHMAIKDVIASPDVYKRGRFSPDGNASFALDNVSNSSSFEATRPLIAPPPPGANVGIEGFLTPVTSTPLQPRSRASSGDSEDTEFTRGSSHWDDERTSEEDASILTSGERCVVS